MIAMQTQITGISDKMIWRANQQSCRTVRIMIDWNDLDFDFPDPNHIMGF